MSLLTNVKTYVEADTVIPAVAKHYCHAITSNRAVVWVYTSALSERERLAEGGLEPQAHTT